MSRWFRMYDDLIHDSKVLRLSDAVFRAWVTLLCIASKNDGKLPPTSDVALMLRVKPSKVAEWLAVLTAGGLFDNNDGVFSPHNWNTRQYKSDAKDPTAAKRSKDYRDRKRDASRSSRRDDSDGTVSVKRPETETETETEQNSDARASGAVAPRDPRSRLFSEGLSKLALLTGKGPDSCRSFIGKCLKAAQDDASVVLGLIDDAERNRVADAPAWISARLKARPQSAATSGLGFENIFSSIQSLNERAGRQPSDIELIPDPAS